MKQAILMRESEKYRTEDILINGGELTVLFVPEKQGFFVRRKIKKVTANKTIIKADAQKTARFLAENLQSIIKRLKVKGKICIVIGSRGDAINALPIIKNRKDAVICASNEIFDEANEFFLNETGAACTVKEFPETKQNLAVFMPDSDFQELPYKLTLLNFSGNGGGITPNDIVFTPISPDKDTVKCAENTDELIAIADFFEIDKSLLKVAKIRTH